MRIKAAHAGLLGLVVLGTLVVGGSTAVAEEQVAVCYVSKRAPDTETDVTVSREKADDLIENTLSYRGICASYGESASLGNGGLKVFSQSRDGVPHAIGVAMPRTTLDGLPYDPPTEGRWCYDVNQDGTVDKHHECVGGYENALHFSDAFRSGVDSQFQYMLINWNPAGHPPPGVYEGAPHFDLHFYLTPNSERLAIRPGPCTVMVNCDDYATAKQPIDPKYIAPDYSDANAVEPGMGNHFIDFTGPEFNGQPFTHSFIYGTYGGEITFYEPMVTHKWFADLAAGTIKDACFAMKLPQAWQTSGWYPTKYCLRYRANRKELTASLEGFVYRTAS